jgi:hypothetical protein
MAGSDSPWRVLVQGNLVDGTPQDGLRSVPPRVNAHYIKLLSEWVCAKLSAARMSHARGPPPGKAVRAAEQASSASAADTAYLSADAEWVGELWWLLGALLRCPGEPYGPREAGMMAGAALDACAAVSQGSVASGLRAALLCGVREALRGLHGNVGAAQPSLEDRWALAVVLRIGARGFLGGER